LNNTLNGRERELAAIRRELPDRIPVDAILVENQQKIADSLHIDVNGVLDRLGIDGRIVSASYLGKLPEPVKEVSYTEFGTPNTGDYGTVRLNPLSNAHTLSRIAEYPWPDPDLYDFAASSRAARELGKRYAVRGPYWKPLFCQVCDLFGMEQAMLRMLAEPQIFEAALDRVFRYTYQFCRNLLEECGDDMPILCLGDDFATQKGMMFSLEHWRRFLKPRYAKLFELGKRSGRYVWFHSCGNIAAVLDDLVEIGLDVWETVQLHTLPFSAEQLKQHYGEPLTFFGGINTQRLPFATSEQIRAEVTQRIEILGRNGGYICGPDHHIKPDVSVQNTLALFETARAFRRRGYTKLE